MVAVTCLVEPFEYRNGIQAMGWLSDHCTTKLQMTIWTPDLSGFVQILWDETGIQILAVQGKQCVWIKFFICLNTTVIDKFLNLKNECIV